MSPSYVAVIELDPTVSAEDVMLAVPLLSNVPVPSEVDPLKNATVPVGVPVPGLAAVTVAAATAAVVRSRIAGGRGA